MIPTAYAVPQENSSPRFATAWAHGCGGAVERDNVLHAGPVAMFGSPARWSLLQQAIGEGRDWYYGDHAYFGRLTYFRVTRNAYQLGGILAPGIPGNSKRLEKLGIEIRPWRSKGEHILLCPPDEPFANLHGFSAAAWTEHMIQSLREFTKVPIRVRERAHAAARKLSEDLADAWCLTTYVSNAAVEALCAGVPVICTGPCAAGMLGARNLSAVTDPPRPSGRRAWAAVLAANQWTMDEIAAGAAWRALGTA